MNKISDAINYLINDNENLKYKVVSDNKLNYAGKDNTPVEVNYISVII